MLKFLRKIPNVLNPVKKYGSYAAGWSGKHLNIKSTTSTFFLSGTTTACAFGIVVYYADANEPPKKKLVILGSGWGAVSLLKSISPGEFDISVVSPDNYFLFTPLLPGVTVGTVEGRSIIEPIRKILSKRHKKNAKFYEAHCTSIAVDQNKVTCTDLSGNFLYSLLPVDLLCRFQKV